MIPCLNFRSDFEGTQETLVSCQHVVTPSVRHGCLRPSSCAEQQDDSECFVIVVMAWLIVANILVGMGGHPDPTGFPLTGEIRLRPDCMRHGGSDFHELQYPVLH